MTKFPCGLPDCTHESDTDTGWKMHRSKSHGPYTTEDLKKAGIKPTQRDIARSLAGNTSAAEVSAQAPDKEPGPGETGTQQVKTRRPRTPQVDPEVEAAKERILRARCERIASLPYSLLAGVCGDESIRLSDKEKQDLTESYVTLCKAYGWEGASKIILWGDVMICHSAIIFQKDRKEAILNAVGMVGQPEAAKEETAQAEAA